MKRALSALVMAPVAAALIWLGGWPFLLFIIALAAVSVFEWGKLSAKTPRPIMLTAGGLLYISVGYLACYMIQLHAGAVLALFFIVLVWASDTGAYFAGKFIGGPKLFPAISPNKTWAGMGGAVAAPFLLALACGPFLEGGVIFFTLAAVLTGLAGQCGDLMVSSLKRLAKSKDSGHLIPGHGGALDRLDSLLLAAPLFLLLYMGYLGGWS